MKISRTMTTLGWACFGLMWIPMCALVARSESGQLDRPWSELDLLSQLIFVASGFLFTMTFVLLLGAPLVTVLRHRTIRAQGEHAEAIILRYWDTGATINENPVIGVEVEVHPADSAPFRAETEWMVPRLQVPKLQAGTIVQVKYDPRHQAVVVISF